MNWQSGPPAKQFAVGSVPGGSWLFAEANEQCADKAEDDDALQNEHWPFL